MTDLLAGARVLITGGTGSLGQTLVRRVLRGELGLPDKLIVFSRDEAKQHAMKATWKHLQRPTDDVWYHNFDELMEFQIGDVRDVASVERAVRRCDVVINAAAMKQVPTCEYFPAQAVATNVLGPRTSSGRWPARNRSTPWSVCRRTRRASRSTSWA